MFIDDPLEIDNQLAKEKRLETLADTRTKDRSLSIAIEYVWRDIT